MLNETEKKELEDLERKESRFFLILFSFIFFIFCFIVGVYYYLNNTKVNIITETKGVVIPSSKVKVVQHLEGGIIKKIHVNTGDIVKKDTVLLELEPIKTLSDYAELEKRLTALSINITRLRAESDDKKLSSDSSNDAFPSGPHVSFFNVYLLIDSTVPLNVILSTNNLP